MLQTKRTDLEDKNKHFHDIVKGCKMKFYKKLVHHQKQRVNGVSVSRPLYMPAQYCLTHNPVDEFGTKILICQCGWEFGWHLGTETEYVSKQAEAYRKIHYAR